MSLAAIQSAARQPERHRSPADVAAVSIERATDEARFRVVERYNLSPPALQRSAATMSSWSSVGVRAYESRTSPRRRSQG